MDITKMLAELRTERDLIEQVITVLERLAQGHHKRLGRPPKWISTIHGEETEEAKPKRFVSAASRKRMSEAQKKRWEARKQATNMREEARRATQER